MIVMLFWLPKKHVEQAGQLERAACRHVIIRDTRPVCDAPTDRVVSLRLDGFAAATAARRIFALDLTPEQLRCASAIRGLLSCPDLLFRRMAWNASVPSAIL